MGKPKVDVSDEQIVEAYRETASAYDVAERFKIGVTTVYRALNRNDIALNGLNQYRLGAERYPREVQLEMKALYESGVRVPTLVERFGGSFSSVKQAILRNGGQMKAPGGKPKQKVAPERIQEILDLFDGGMSQRAIGDRLGHCQSTISRVLIENGIRTRARTNHKATQDGRVMHHQGYWYIWIPPDDPMAPMRIRSGYVLEHRLVMARFLGRILLPTETVHHINGDRADNRPENLQLIQGRHGKGVVMCCRNCGSRNIGPVEIETED